MAGSKKDDPGDARTRDVAPRGSDAAWLLLVHDDGPARGVDLEHGAVVTVGRGADCQVAVASASVSRRHVQLTIGESIELHDLGSHNGTKVNGVVVEPRGKARLGAGDVIALGDALLVVRPRAARAADARPAPGDAVIVDPAMKRLYARTAAVAATDLAVLVLGETGVGKERLAAWVHGSSTRASRPLVRINCAAIAESVAESELFGHVRGAFTGADARKVGLLEAADTGTVFLDEVGELPLRLQAKLLRFLEDGEVTPVGGVSARKVDVRVVSATNRDLRAMCREQEFREDLFFRLNGVTLTIPPLRERPADILPLVRRTLASAATRYGKLALDLSPDAEVYLLAQPWRGNVRELVACVWRAAVLATPPTLSAADLRDDTADAPPPPPRDPAPPDAAPEASLRSDLRLAERRRIEQALAGAGGDTMEASRVLGISRRGLQLKMKKLGLDARPWRRSS